ncbi:MAG: hypothetical protein HYR63_23515 [Proteobacteria bacterium]|nr:hypothetical protein [Pseudomonadota bacterium]MBI3507976.1 hypothetical protein [Pseudomonadota bacterium]
MAATRLLGMVGLVAVVVTFAAGSAWADVIDGEWCYATNRHLMIKGPSIVTPGGNQLSGNYTRHSFSYVVPASEPGAGQTVNMTLVNEDTVNLRMDTAGTQGPIQVWRRCAGRVSALPLPRSAF